MSVLSPSNQKSLPTSQENFWFDGEQMLEATVIAEYSRIDAVPESPHQATMTTYRAS